MDSLTCDPSNGLLDLSIVVALLSPPLVSTNLSISGSLASSDPAMVLPLMITLAHCKGIQVCCS